LVKRADEAVSREFQQQLVARDEMAGSGVTCDLEKLLVVLIPAARQGWRIVVLCRDGPAADCVSGKELDLPLVRHRELTIGEHSAKLL
jgi:hypothetical protein